MCICEQICEWTKCTSVSFLKRNYSYIHSEYIYKQLAYVANILQETTSFASQWAVGLALQWATPNTYNLQTNIQRNVMSIFRFLGVICLLARDESRQVQLPFAT